MSNIYNQNLEKNSANYQPLTPITFLERAASVYPERVAVIYGKQEYNYSEFYRRCRQLASFLSKKGISFGDTVSVPLANTLSIWKSIMRCLCVEVCCTVSILALMLLLLPFN